MDPNQPAEPFPAEDFRATATAFSQLAGVLGGFCFTILVLVLSPDFLEGSEAKDWILGLLLLAAIAYILSSSMLANSMNALVLKTLRSRRRVFLIGIFLSNLGHILLSVTITLLVYQFSSTVGVIAAVIILLIALVNALLNFGLESRIMKG